MRKVIAIQVLMVTLASFLVVERASSDDLEHVLQSQNKWEELKQTHAGDYQYVVKREGFSPKKAQPRKPDLQLTAENNGQNFQVPVGGIIAVQLEGNRTTGFSWNNATKSKNLELVGEIQYAAKESLLGSGGVATATFRASKVGKATLVLEYKRVFEKKPAAKTFQITVEVQEPGSEGEATKTYQAPNGKQFPAHWGAPPKIQTRDLRPLPGGYGKGSGTLAKWIQANLDNELQLTAENNGQNFQVPVGGIIAVQLEGNRTTGFSWNNATKSKNLELVGEIQYAAKESLLGSGGVATATFRASKVGKATLVLEYKRVFEKKPAAKTFQITVEVQEPGSEGEATKTYQAPNGKQFPAHWGAPPKIQTRDLRPLPGGYGKGSGTLAKWIQANLDDDAKGGEHDK